MLNKVVVVYKLQKRVKNRPQSRCVHIGCGRQVIEVTGFSHCLRHININGSNSEWINQSKRKLDEIGTFDINYTVSMGMFAVYFHLDYCLKSRLSSISIPGGFKMRIGPPYPQRVVKGD